jgi:hypothetical protein
MDDCVRHDTNARTEGEPPVDHTMRLIFTAMIDAWMHSRTKRSPPKQQLHLQQDALIRELFDSFITDREFDDKDHIK